MSGMKNEEITHFTYYFDKYYNMDFMGEYQYRVMSEICKKIVFLNNPYSTLCSMLLLRIIRLLTNLAVRCDWHSFRQCRTKNKITSGIFSFRLTRPFYPHKDKWPKLHAHTNFCGSWTPSRNDANMYTGVIATIIIVKTVCARPTPKPRRRAGCLSVCVWELGQSERCSSGWLTADKSGKDSRKHAQTLSDSHQCGSAHKPGIEQTPTKPGA